MDELGIERKRALTTFLFNFNRFFKAQPAIMNIVSVASFLLANNGGVLLGVQAQHPMEKLGRGVVAVRTNDTDVLVSWRLLGLGPDDLAFNIYRASGNADAVQLNDDALTGGTNYADHDADSRGLS